MSNGAGLVKGSALCGKDRDPLQRQHCRLGWALSAAAGSIIANAIAVVALV